MLECVSRQLPVHPRQWRIAATTCTELSEAVVNLRELTTQAICDEHELQSITEGGKLLMKRRPQQSNGGAAADRGWSPSGLADLLERSIVATEVGLAGLL